MRSDEGFTLLELLIVLAIIGLLAAIAVPMFLAQKQKGWIAQSQSALRDAATAIESHAVDSGGSYEGTDGQCADSKGNPCTSGDDAILKSQGYKRASSVRIEVRAGSNAYCIIATHDSLDPGPPPHDWWVSTWNSDAPGPSDEDSCPGF